MIFITRKKPRTMCPEFIKGIIKACSITTTPSLLRVSANYHWTINNRWLPLTALRAADSNDLSPFSVAWNNFLQWWHASFTTASFSRAKLGEGGKDEKILEAISSKLKQNNSSINIFDPSKFTEFSLNTFSFHFP